MALLVFHTVMNEPWWQAATALQRSLEDNATDVELGRRGLALAAALAERGFADVETAVLSALLETELPTTVETIPAGLATLLNRDVATLAALVARDFASELAGRGITGVPLSDLAPAAAPWLEPWRGHSAAELQTMFLTHVQAHGSGVSAVYPAMRWRGGALEPVRQPDLPHLAGLHGIDEQLKTLKNNTEALVNGKRAHNVLLYGPRGSGKSTALRGLGHAYHEAGLRLVEVTTDDLSGLDELRMQLARKPLKFIVFVDDLAFDDGDARYRPLKSMLDGGLQHHPQNVVVYATSNRRHIIKESIYNRPDPLDDDLHRFDAEHEQLALADRFGITITFPGATQRRYVEIVEALTAEAGITGEPLGERAIRFAEWHNGYSGRTARQFVDELLKER